mmetsp:Transcript_7491/g.10548  ORF Transcript_7491/g.10548 Transcript_7491/m.10548 type:complete len:1407 (-) Transcript_7491:707-4927(-)
MQQRDTYLNDFAGLGRVVVPGLNDGSAKFMDQNGIIANLAPEDMKSRMMPTNSMTMGPFDVQPFGASLTGNDNKSLELPMFYEQSLLPINHRYQHQLRDYQSIRPSFRGPAPSPPNRTWDLGNFTNFSSHEVDGWLSQNSMKWNLKGKTLEILRQIQMDGNSFLMWTDEEMIKVGITTGQRKYLLQLQTYVRGNVKLKLGPSSHPLPGIKGRKSTNSIKRKLNDGEACSAAHGTKLSDNRKKKKKRSSNSKECIAGRDAAEVPWRDFAMDLLGQWNEHRVEVYEFFRDAAKMLESLMSRCEATYRSSNSTNWQPVMKKLRDLIEFDVNIYNPGYQDGSRLQRNNVTPQSGAGSMIESLASCSNVLHSNLTEFLNDEDVIASGGHIRICDCTKCTPNKNSLLCLLCKSFSHAWALKERSSKRTLHFPDKGIFPVKKSCVIIKECDFHGFRNKKKEVTALSSGFYYDCFYNYNRTRYFKPTKCNKHLETPAFYSRVLRFRDETASKKCFHVFHLKSNSKVCECLMDVAPPKTNGEVSAMTSCSKENCPTLGIHTEGEIEASTQESGTILKAEVVSYGQTAEKVQKYYKFQYCSPDDRKHRKRIIQAFDAALGRYGGFLHVDPASIENRESSSSPSLKAANQTKQSRLDQGNESMMLRAVISPPKIVRGFESIQPSSKCDDRKHLTNTLKSEINFHEKNVLIVGDSTSMRKYMSRIFTKLGCHVESAQDGKEGLEMLRTRTKSPYDMAFVDVNMTRMDGIKMVTQARAAGYPGRIVAVSASINSERVIIESGFNDFYEKKPLKENTAISLFTDMNSIDKCPSNVIRNCEANVSRTAEMIPGICPGDECISQEIQSLTPHSSISSLSLSIPDRYSNTVCHTTYSLLSDVKAEPRYQYLYMTSNPLIDENCQAIEELNVGQEWSEIKNTLSHSNKAIRIRRMHATTANFREAITLGCQVLHYSGHGQRNNLVFEDNEAKAQLLEVKALRKLFEVGNSCRTVKVVFVAACYSEASGNAFVGAGVKHVIAVRIDQSLEDKAAIIFTKQFYLALTNDHTVKEAFDIAKEAVKSSSVGSAESEKFLLLPKDKNHNVRIFAELPPGSVIDLTPPPPPQNLTAPSPYFIGRNNEMQKAIHLLKDNETRIITLTGTFGIGKAETATAISRYCLQRSWFEDGMVLIDLKDSKDKGPKSILSQIAKTLRIEAKRQNQKQQNSTPSDEEILKRLEKKNILIMILRIDEIMSSNPEWRDELSSLITQMLRNCLKIKLLTTSCVKIRKLLGFPRSILESTIPVGPMNDFHSTCLLLKIARPIVVEEITTDPNLLKSLNPFVLLSKHPIIKACKGHPQKLCEVANFMEDHSLGDSLQLLCLSKPRIKVVPSKLDPDEMEFDTFWRKVSVSGTLRVRASAFRIPQ